MTTKQTWTEKEYKLGIEHYDDGVTFAQEGNLFSDNRYGNSFDGFRKAYAERHGRNTTLTDDQIIVLWMSANDDHDGDNWWLDRVDSAEEYFATGYTGPVLNAYAEHLKAQAEDTKHNF